MKIKTSELIGPALDWAVAKCEGIEVVAWHTEDRYAYFVVLAGAFIDKHPLTTYGDPDDTYYPSFNWAQGGPIIEHEGIHVGLTTMCGEYAWEATMRTENVHFGEYGPTPLIAAMRCFAASKLGDEVEIPDELLIKETP